MKTIKKLPALLLISIFSLIAFNIKSQNYEVIKTDAEYFFVDSADYDITAIRIDSTRVIGSDVYYYNFKQMREIDSVCYTADGNSWLGDLVVEKPDGTYIITVYPYFQSDSAHIYRIKSQSTLNQPWVLYSFHDSDEYVEAKLTEIRLMNFIGLSDSVRVIQLTRKNAAGEIINDMVNNEKLLISKNYGIIRLTKFDEIPYYTMYKFYDLVGKTNPDMGVVNLKTMQIYDFQPGDEFHTSYFSRSYIPPQPILITKISTISKVLERIDYPSGDSVTYLFARCQTNCIYEYYPSNCTNTTDTLYQTYSGLTTPEFETQPLEVAVETSNGDLATYFFMGFMPGGWFQIYNVPLKYRIRNLCWSNNNGCYSIVIPSEYCNSLEYYLKGLGGPYYRCDVIWGPNNKLLYYKKGSETWGSPLDCDSLLVVGLPEYPLTWEIKIYPNPSTENIIVSTPSGLDMPCQFTLYDISGRKVKSLILFEHLQSIDISDTPGGIYLYKIISSKNEVFHGKIIRQ